MQTRCADEEKAEREGIGKPFGLWREPKHQKKISSQDEEGKKDRSG